ncbi:hypothetical protein MY7_0596 [Bacillus sp. 5B6]|nr:hypothetical protein MY7_0596 [Bacillus sp. 5B6]
MRNSTENVQNVPFGFIAETAKKSQGTENPLGSVQLTPMISLFHYP